MDIIVKFNGITITPTPYVEQSYQFIDYGQRWGNVLQIQLRGYIANVGGSGDITGAFMNTFLTGQFGKLEVFESGTNIYSWDTMNMEQIDISPNHFYQQSFVPYSIKMHKYNVPSGVVDPINEYAFSQGEDGIVTLTHKISAHGVKASSNGAFQNAITFVRSLTGRNSLNSSSTFISTGQGILTSLSETINRAEGIYSLTEVYKYNTGSANSYLTWFNTDISDVMENEYLTVNTDLKIQGSTVNKNLSSLESQVPAIDDTFSRLNALGIATGAFMRNSTTITRDSGAAVIEIKNSFLSGYNVSDSGGFFEYNVSMEKDEVLPRESWKINGNFVCKGPLNVRQQQLNNFKASNGADWRSYLTGLIVSSSAFSNFHNPTTILSPRATVDIQENTGLAIFTASCVMIEGGNSFPIDSPKYTVEISPSIWSYELLPAANIEGHYIVQDLQMMTQSKMSFSVSSETEVPWSGLPILSGFMSALEALYINSGSSRAESYNTGYFTAACSREWLGIDQNSYNLLNTKVVGDVTSSYVRQAGYKFGY